MLDRSGSSRYYSFHQPYPEVTMKKSFIVYFVAVTGIYIAAIVIAGSGVAGAGPAGFWDLPSFILTPVAPFILMLGHYGPGEIVRAFRCAGAGECGPADAGRALVFFRSLRRLVMLSGFLGSLIGAIFIARMYPSGEFSANAGVYLGTCLLTVVYALFFSMVLCVPFESALEKKLAE